jgi:hypothetical protein
MAELIYKFQFFFLLSKSHYIFQTERHRSLIFPLTFFFLKIVVNGNCDRKGKPKENSNPNLYRRFSSGMTGNLVQISK